MNQSLTLVVALLVAFVAIVVAIAALVNAHNHAQRADDADLAAAHVGLLQQQLAAAKQLARRRARRSGDATTEVPNVAS